MKQIPVQAPTGAAEAVTECIQDFRMKVEKEHVKFKPWLIYHTVSGGRDMKTAEAEKEWDITFAEAGTMTSHPIEADWLEENGWEAEAALLRGEHAGPVDSGALAALEAAGFEDAACELERRAVEHGIAQYQLAANMSRAAVIELIQSVMQGFAVKRYMKTAEAGKE